MMTHSEIDAGLKVLYSGQRLLMVQNGEESRVLMNDCTKPMDFAGKNKPCPVYWDDAGGGRSRTFTVAQANADEVKIGEFDIDVVPDNDVVRVSTQSLLRSRNERGSFIEQQALKVDNGINNLANALEKSLWRSATEELGRLNTSSFATTSLDLVTDSDVKNFQVGMHIVFASSTSGALRDGGKALKITKIDKTATSDQITVAANLNTVSGIAQNDYIFAEGDAQDGGTAAKGINGMPDWVPTTLSATEFFGQDRTESALELGGLNTTGKYSDIVKSCVDAMFKHVDLLPKVKTDVGYLNPRTFARLVDQVGQDVQREPGTKTTAGYRYISIQGPKAEVRMKPACYCAENTIWLCDKSVLYLESMLEPVRIDRDDGLIVRAISNAKGVECRLDSHCQFRLKVPGFVNRLTLS
jgi:hypothetical protein